MSNWLSNNPIHIETNHGKIHGDADGDADWAAEVNEDGTLKGAGEDGQIILWRDGDDFWAASQDITIHVDEIEFVVEMLRKARNAIHHEQGKALARRDTEEKGK